MNKAIEADLKDVKKFVKKYKKATKNNKDLTIGPSIINAVKNTSLTESNKDSLIIQVDILKASANNTFKKLPKEIQAALRKKKMDGLDYFNFLLNGGKTYELVNNGKVDELRKASRPASSKEDELRPATRAVSSKEDELRPSTKPKSTKVDELRPATKPKKPLGKNIREKVDNIERPKPKPKPKPKKKYDKPPAYCFTRKPADRDPYVVCVASFV